MVKTVRANFSKGAIKLLEKVDIEEGKEITITIMQVPSKGKQDSFERSAGVWKGTIDAGKIDREYLCRSSPVHKGGTQIMKASTCI